MPFLVVSWPHPSETSFAWVRQVAVVVVPAKRLNPSCGFNISSYQFTGNLWLLRTVMYPLAYIYTYIYISCYKT